jgi:DNA-binding MarR family transcriptional regulator
MKRKPQGPKTKTARRSPPARRSNQSVTLAQPVRHGSQLEKVLSLIRVHPGIRPSEINRRLNLEQSDGLRATLIKRGLIRKEKDGMAMRYYVV